MNAIYYIYISVKRLQYELSCLLCGRVAKNSGKTQKLSWSRNKQTLFLKTFLVKKNCHSSYLGTEQDTILFSQKKLSIGVESWMVLKRRKMHKLAMLPKHLVDRLRGPGMIQSSAY